MSVGTTLRFWLGARHQSAQIRSDRRCSRLLLARDKLMINKQWLTRCGAAGQWRHAEPVRATVLWGSADGSVAAGLGIDPDAQREVRFLTEILDDFRRFVDEIWLF